MKPNLTNPGKVVITIATTGGLHGKESNPALPEQPKDIIQNFRDCYNAGATVAHMHVRDKRGVTTADHRRLWRGDRRCDVALPRHDHAGRQRHRRALRKSEGRKASRSRWKSA